jgi:ATP-dependent exoDNAse (exonuclease V) beta subunit
MSLTVIKAVAGSGKTHQIINELDTETKTLIVTYTKSNRDQIINGTIIKFGFLPKNIIILTWLEFLFRDLARPYSNQFSKGMKLDGMDIYTKKENLPNVAGVTQETSEYYINSKNQIYDFRLPLFCYKIIVKSSLVLDRLGRLYNKIYIDEAQDLCGNDYDIVGEVVKKIDMIIVGDSFQNTYDTHQTTKYKGKKTGYVDIFDYIVKNNIPYNPKQLNKTRRFGKNICKFINDIFPDINMEPHEDILDEGFIDFIYDDEIKSFVSVNKPIALTYDKNTPKKVHTEKRINIGESKGLGFTAILIYCSKDMLEACLKKDSSKLAQQTRYKLYVALSRARKVVGIYINETKNSLKSDPFF